MMEQWADYLIDVPETGTYQITMKAACVNIDQVLEVSSGDKKLATVPIVMDFGLWAVTKPVELKLAKGVQKLRVETPRSAGAEHHERGIALRWFDLKLVK